MHRILEAWDEYKKAKHLLNVTFSITKDPKLLLGIITNIHTSMQLAIEVQKEQRQQQNPEIMQIFQEIKEINSSNKNSPVTFRRKDKFVICSPDYHMKELSAAKTNLYLKHNYSLLHQVLALINRKQ
jgi:hypothetical protein